ncbi:hypothetical protein Plhal304r1_c030g0098631 [Plasmopara halstedii]
MSADLWSPTYRGIIFLVLTFSLVVCFTFYMPAPEDASAQSGQRFLKQMVPYDPDYNDERLAAWLDQIVQPQRKVLSDVKMRLTFNKDKLVSRLFAKNEINPVQEDFFKSAEFLQVADMIKKAFFIKSKSTDAIFNELIRAAHGKEYEMLESLARSIGELRAEGEIKIRGKTLVSATTRPQNALSDDEAKDFKRLRASVLALEPYLLYSWKEMSVSSEQAKKSLSLDLSSPNFLDSPHLPLYIKYLDMTSRLDPFRTLLFEMKEQGLRDHVIVSKLLDAGAMTKPDSIPRKIMDSMFLDWDIRSVSFAGLYKILVPDLSITDNTVMIYKELAGVIVTSRLVESDTGVELVAIEKNVDEYMPPIPERDKQLADLLALNVFGTDKSSINRFKTLIQHGAQTPSRRMISFAENLFEGLRMHWSDCGLSPQTLLFLTDTEKLEHEELLTSPHLWTFLVYTTEHVRSSDERGEQLFAELQPRLSDEEIASLLAEMRVEDINIFEPLVKRLSGEWNSRGESLKSLATTLGLDEDPLSNPIIAPMFYYYRQFDNLRFENVLLIRKFLTMKYPEGQDLDELIKGKMVTENFFHREALSEMLFAPWLNEGLSVKNLKGGSEAESELRDMYRSAMRIAKHRNNST